MSEPIHARAECELIPEGPSCTETAAAYSVYIRNGDLIFSVRVRKPDLHYSTPKVEERDR